MAEEAIGFVAMIFDFYFLYPLMLVNPQTHTQAIGDTDHCYQLFKLS